MQFAALAFLPTLALLAGAAPLAYYSPGALPVPTVPRTGEATFYQPGRGACGLVHKATDMIAAVAVGRGKSECGKKVRVVKGDKYVDVVIQDLCALCKPGDIDLTPGAFKKLSDADAGRIPIQWSYQ